MPRPTEQATKPYPGIPVLGRRRRFLLAPQMQLRVASWCCVIALLLLVPLNVALYWASTLSTERLVVEVPALAASLEARDRWQLALTLGASLIFLGGVFALGVLESHRTAGAARNLERCLDQIAAGRFETRAALRRGDSLGDLARAFNRMAEALERRERP